MRCRTEAAWRVTAAMQDSFKPQAIGIDHPPQRSAAEDREFNRYLSMI